MTNITSIFQPIDNIQEHVEKGIFLDRVRQGVKNAFGVWDPIQSVTVDIKVLGFDAMSDGMEHLGLASTWEGAAAQASFIFVHDIPQLSELGLSVTDGHAMFVSQSKMDDLLKHPHQFRSWMREGAGLCASLALPLDAPKQTPSQWKAVSSSTITDILRRHPNAQRLMECYSPNPAQDAWRYASAIKLLCVPTDTPWFSSATKIDRVDLTSGMPNQAWQGTVNVLDELHNSFVWQHRARKTPSSDDVIHFLTKLFKHDDLNNGLQTRLFSLIAKWNPHLDIQEKIRIAKECAKLDISRNTIESMIDALSSNNCDGKLLQKREYEKHHARIVCYINVLNNCVSPSPTSLFMACVGKCDPSSSAHKGLLEHIIKQAAHSGPYTSNQLKDIARKVPSALQAALRATSPSEPVLCHSLLSGKIRDLFNVVVWNSYKMDGQENGFSPSSYTNLLINLIETDQASFSLDAENITKDRLDVWSRLARKIENDVDGPKHWESIVAAAVQKNPRFATDLLSVWCLGFGIHPASPFFLETLIDQGADLLANHSYPNIPPATIASELLNSCQVPSIRVKAQRALKEKQDQRLAAGNSSDEPQSHDSHESKVVSLCAVRKPST